MDGSVVIFDNPPLAPRYDEIESALRMRGIPIVRAPGTPVSLERDDIRDADVWLIGAGMKVDHSALASSSRLRGLVTFGKGTNAIDLSSANLLGFPVAHGAVDENEQSMAEATVMLMLCLAYDLRGAECFFRGGVEKPDWPNARMLRSLKVGLIGFGGIAQEVAKRLQPFGCSILATARRQLDEPAVRQTSLDELLRECDIVSVHLALNDDTRHVLDRRRLDSMKRGAFLINVSRGALVDEDALADVVESGHLAGVALDTFAIEPLPLSHRLRRMRNAILTPHMVGHTQQSLQALTDLAVRNIVLLLDGKSPDTQANPGVPPRQLKGVQDSGADR